MAKEQQKQKPVILERVRSHSCYLNRADDKFGDPVKKTKIVFESMEDAQHIIDMLEAAQQGAIQIAVEESKDKGKVLKPEKVKLAELPVKMEEDRETGEETGRVLIGPFKMKVGGTTKEGREWKRELPVFTMSGKLVNLDETAIWSGSILNLCVIFKPFYTAALGAGVSCVLDAVQVVELRSGSSTRDAAGYGFGTEACEEEEEESFPSPSGGEDEEAPF